MCELVERALLRMNGSDEEERVLQFLLLSFFLLYSFFMYILLKGMYSRFGCGGYREMDHQIQKKRSSHHKQVNERDKTDTFSLVL